MNFLKRLLFYRVVLIGFALFIQLAVLIGVIIRFNDYFVFFYWANIIISILVVFWIINNNINPDYKIAWIILILVFPIFGGLFYIFFGRGNTSWRKMQNIIVRSIAALQPTPMILAELALKNETAANQSKYLQSYAYSPVYKNTSTEYLPIGEITFERLQEELKKAERYIFLEYFIIEEGVMWNSILEILVEKAGQGLDVRVIYDDVGCLLTLPHRYDKYLEKLGIKCCVFNRLIPVLSLGHNNRDHRKIAVIDGHIGFTGGINLADEYINAYEKYGHWKDSAIMLRGEAVWSFTIMFLTMWGYLRGVEEDFNQFKPKPLLTTPKEAGGYVQPFADNPLDHEPVGEIVYLNMINKARKYVYICTPYLIVDSQILTALTSAAKGGVDVRIITPYIGDKRFVQAVSRSYYKNLINNGVKIYEYLPGFMHSKTYISDDCYGIVGTINMDYRSLYMHFECGVWLYNNSIMQIKEDFLTTLEMCKPADPENIRWYELWAGSILRIFAPLM
ncbi:MAG: cardiolipin synthase [Syntrophomonadaceae bacterium]|nr:cardiolipin synthase [Syntrophomonadaceae bacterium]